MTLTEKDIDEALDRLDAGLELVIDASGARWQLPGRSAIRFWMDRERGQALLSRLSDRFRVRSGRGRHVLSTEPIDTGDDEAAEPEDETTPDRLYRRWHRVVELAEMVSRSKEAIRQTLIRYEDRLHIEQMSGTGGTPKIVRSNGALQEVLEAVYDVYLPIDIDGSLTPRVPLPSSVTLRKPVYTKRELGERVGRSGAAARGLFRKCDGLTFIETTSPESGHTVSGVVADEALADAMEDYWSLDVTIAPKTEAEPREVAA